jgi:hypothetical protein
LLFWQRGANESLSQAFFILGGLLRKAAFALALACCFSYSLAKANSPNQEGEAPAARAFNEVLADIIDEFSYDLKTSQVPLLANVSMRKISLSENVPNSYEKYLETVVGERVRQFSQAKVIHCTTCRVKQSVVRDGRVYLVSPINNKRALDQLAREYGIEAWLDIGLVYEQSAMVLAFNLFNARTKELLWSKVYNSETLYKRFPSGVPDPSLERKDLPEQPAGQPSEYIFGAAIGWALVPNVNETTSMLAIPLRFAEVFNKKRSEAGAQVVALIDTDALLGQATPAQGVNVEESEEVVRDDNTRVIRSFRYGAGIFATYHHNFRTSEDDMDLMRPGLQLGAGMIVAENYLSFSAKIGTNLRMGRSLFLDVDALYSFPSTIQLIDGYTFKTQGGLGALASFGIQF